MAFEFLKYCPICGRKMVKREDGSWKCSYCRTVVNASGITVSREELVTQIGS